MQKNANFKEFGQWKKNANYTTCMFPQPWVQFQSQRCDSSLPLAPEGQHKGSNWATVDRLSSRLGMWGGARYLRVHVPPDGTKTSLRPPPTGGQLRG